jgi:hypothetical protein
MEPSYPYNLDHSKNNRSIGPYKIPTWTTPLMLVVVISILVPGVSLIGHLCGTGIGYLCKPPHLLPLLQGPYADCLKKGERVTSNS